MTEKPEVRLIWEGPSSLANVLELVAARVNFELQLPPDYHFTLFRHLYPQAAPDAPEQIDLNGTAELFNRVAAIPGLQELAVLAAPITARQARVRIQSPGPGILVCFPDHTSEPSVTTA